MVTHAKKLGKKNIMIYFLNENNGGVNSCFIMGDNIECIISIYCT